MEAAGIEEENRAEVAFMEEPLDPWRKSPIPQWSWKLVELQLHSEFRGAGTLPNTTLIYLLSACKRSSFDCYSVASIIYHIGISTSVIQKKIYLAKNVLRNSASTRISFREKLQYYY
jgi:hypothetical protein